MAAFAKCVPPPKRLTLKQQATLELLCKGLRNAEIGAVLGMSERNVKNYVSQLLLIFDATNRTELVGIWSAQGQSESTEPSDIERSDAAEVNT